ncbi:C4b-binding protein alpha chain-like isoform X2 [Artibeus jamaicensis]|uniref:C4b-binding protein alpha chain-like isoform X2 n=1 Tax=Artibeus jamaicensis TaxID=9417 RepID=UPI00235A9740|nr:C4b-binding protein alpha chain-like isoform X2 [Artibeus jamaicensis]
MSEMQLLTMPPKLQRTFPALCLLGVLFLLQSLPVLCDVCCPVPNLRNGRITSQRKSSLASNCEYFYGDSLSYSCGRRRSVEASCQADGTWSPETPVCEESCSYPPLIAHGRYIEKSSYLFQPKEVKYECDEGYTLVGVATLSCSHSRWSGPAPQCKALCPKPKIEHGKVFGDKDQFVESENVTIKCASGYTVVGHQNITCLENHTWYPEVPKCEWTVQYSVLCFWMVGQNTSVPQRPSGKLSRNRSKFLKGRLWWGQGVF